MPRSSTQRNGMMEVAIVGGFVLLVTAVVLSTYARFPAEEFYHVSRDGLAGGASRALVFLNYPVAFIALALLPVAVSSLLARAWHSRTVVIAAIVAALLCLVAGVPDVVTQSDLDAKPINALPAIGVAITFALVLLAIRANGLEPVRPWQRPDTVAAMVAGVFTLLGLPWILAIAGFYIEDVPLLGRIFMSKGTENGVEQIYVHLGDHHSFDGYVFLISALVLRRVVGMIQPHWLDRLLSVFVAFMAAYGIANFIQDGWYEQVVRRGWSSYDIPNTTVPALTPVWGLILLGTLGVWFVMFHEPASGRRSHRQTVIMPS